MSKENSNQKNKKWSKLKLFVGILYLMINAIPALLILILAIGMLFGGTSGMSSGGLANNVTSRPSMIAHNRHENPISMEMDQGEDVPIHNVDFIDIGNADATLLYSEDIVIMIDTGSAERSKDVQEHLIDLGIDHIDAVVLTCGKADYIGGFHALAKAFPIGVVIASDSLRGSLSAVTSEVNYKNTGDAWQLGSVQFLALSVNSSMIMKVSIGEISFLFLSDAAMADEEALVYSEYDITADIIKAAGHAKADSASEELHKAVGASYVIVTCEDRQDAVDIHAKIRLFKNMTGYKTGTYGTIRIHTDGEDYKVISW